MHLNIEEIIFQYLKEPYPYQSLKTLPEHCRSIYDPLETPQKKIMWWIGPQLLLKISSRSACRGAVTWGVADA